MLNVHQNVRVVLGIMRWMMSRCEFNEAWRGKCGKEDCDEHKHLKCCSCGDPATRSCPHAGSLVCGAPLCDKCWHDKSNSHSPNPYYIPKEQRFKVGNLVTIDDGAILYYIRDRCGNKYRLGSSTEWTEANSSWKEFRIHE